MKTCFGLFKILLHPHLFLKRSNPFIFKTAVPSIPALSAEIAGTCTQQAKLQDRYAMNYLIAVRAFLAVRLCSRKELSCIGVTRSFLEQDKDTVLCCLKVEYTHPVLPAGPGSSPTLQPFHRPVSVWYREREFPPHRYSILSPHQSGHQRPRILLFPGRRPAQSRPFSLNLPTGLFAVLFLSRLCFTASALP